MHFAANLLQQQPDCRTQIYIVYCKMRNFLFEIHFVIHNLLESTKKLCEFFCRPLLKYINFLYLDV